MERTEGVSEQHEQNARSDDGLRDEGRKVRVVAHGDHPFATMRVEKKNLWT